VDSSSHRFDALLKPGPLTTAEKRSRAIQFNALFYAAAAIDAVFLISFPKEWLVTSVIWCVAVWCLMMWLRSARKRRALIEGVQVSPEQRSDSLREGARHLRRASFLLIISGVGFIFTGMYNSAGYFIGGLLLVFSLFLNRYAKRLRRTK
jgi:hypothetical protein